MTEQMYYLASSEGYGLEEPRRCYPIRRLRGDYRDDYLLTRIDPPIIGQPFGLGDRDIGHVILATRHVGESLFPIRRWPVFVHVARLLVPLEERNMFHEAEMQAFAWAELYRTEEEARAKIV